MRYLFKSKLFSLEIAIVVMTISLIALLIRPYWVERAKRIEPGTTGLWKYDPEVSRYPGVIYLPTQYDNKKQDDWPLLLHLHGSGERGGSPWKMNDWEGPMGAATKYDLPMIVYSPHCPADLDWNSKLLLETIDALEQEYRIDSQRIYLGGYSMGGYGTWALAANSPERFAAIVPVAGGGDANDGSKFVDLPVWAFHGKRDRAVPVEKSEEMVTAIRDAGGDPKLTIFPHDGHRIWSTVFRDREVYRWLLTKKRE